MLLGCALPKAIEETEGSPVESLVDRRLREAGEAITRDLAIVAGSSQNRDMENPVGAEGLYENLSLTWDGPIEGALSFIAARIGYRFTISGRAPVTPHIVRVRMLDRPALYILREIGLQTSKDVGLEVDEPSRAIRLVYPGAEAKK
jgi:hypothetical protein